MSLISGIVQLLLHQGFFFHFLFIFSFCYCSCFLSYYRGLKRFSVICCIHYLVSQRTGHSKQEGRAVTKSELVCLVWQPPEWKYPPVWWLQCMFAQLRDTLSSLVMDPNSGLLEHFPAALKGAWSVSKYSTSVCANTNAHAHGRTHAQNAKLKFSSSAPVHG